MDTVFVNSSNVKLFSWDLVIATSFITAMVLFFLNLVKDIFFEKGKNKELKNKIKFEKIYNRKIEVTEKVIDHLENAVETLNEYLLNFKEFNSDKVKSTMWDLRRYINRSSIYLSTDIKNKIKILEKRMVDNILKISDLKSASNEPITLRKEYDEAKELQTDIMQLTNDIIKEFEQFIA